MNLQNYKEGFRKCVTCKEEKPLDAEHFYRDKNRLGGLMYRCKGCDKKRPDNRDTHQRWLNLNPTAKARVKEAGRKYQQTPMGKASGLLGSYKTFDKKKGYENDLTTKDMLEARNSLCVYCGGPATGFDRIDNKKGHTKENCVTCCKECNVSRMDNFTHEEMNIIGEAIRVVRAVREKAEFGNCIL